MENIYDKVNYAIATIMPRYYPAETAAIASMNDSKQRFTEYAKLIIRIAEENPHAADLYTYYGAISVYRSSLSDTQIAKRHVYMAI